MSGTKIETGTEEKTEVEGDRTREGTRDLPHIHGPGTGRDEWRSRGSTSLRISLVVNLTEKGFLFGHLRSPVSLRVDRTREDGSFVNISDISETSNSFVVGPQTLGTGREVGGSRAVDDL